MPNILIRSFGLIILATSALAQTEQTPYTQSPAYKECTQLAGSNPTAALAKADEWLKIDSGVAAQHCRAMALYGLRRYDEAAIALSQVRDLLPRESLSMRSYVARQSARSWVNASRADAALAVLSAQIGDLNQVHGANVLAAKLTSELMLERARLNITYGKLPEALSDLDHAVSLTPTNEEVLLERAQTFAQLGDTGLAKADTQAVLKLNPGNAKASSLLQQLNKPAPPVAAQ